MKQSDTVTKYGTSSRTSRSCDLFTNMQYSGVDQRSGLHVNWWSLRKNTKRLNFSSTTFTTVFKICLYTRCFDSSLCPHNIFWWHFADSSKLLKNNLITANLNEVKSSSLTKWFFKSLEESAKCRQKILCSHTDESKHLVHRHILKTVEKVVEEKFKFLCFSSLPAIRRANPLIFRMPGSPNYNNIFQPIRFSTKSCRCSNNSKAHIFIFKGQYFPLPTTYLVWSPPCVSLCIHNNSILFICRILTLQGFNKMNINTDNGKPWQQGEVLWIAIIFYYDWNLLLNNFRFQVAG